MTKVHTISIFFSADSLVVRSVAASEASSIVLVGNPKKDVPLKRAYAYDLRGGARHQTQRNETKRYQRWPFVTTEASVAVAIPEEK